MPQVGWVGLGNFGCLLPLLIIFNLFFGKLIFGSTGLWLGVEAVLILIFMLKLKLMVSKISKLFKEQGPDAASGWGQNRNPGSRGKIIDVQSQEVEDGKLP